MKFTAIDHKHNKDTYEEISSDEQESIPMNTQPPHKKSRIDKLVHDLKPINVNAPTIHILV